MIAETMTLTYDNLIGDNPVSIETMREEAMVALSAAGVARERIAEVLAVSVEKVIVFLQSPAALVRVSTMREELFGADPQARARVSSASAWRVIDELMTNERTKDAIKLAAATATLDRAHGKAAQHVEVGSTLLRTLIERLDRRPAAALPPARVERQVGAIPSPVAPSPARISDSPSTAAKIIDAWVETTF